MVIRMFTIFNLAAGHTVVLPGPQAKVHHLASLGAKRPEAIGRAALGWLLANRAARHFRIASKP
jgi:hypothetical protein